MTNATCYAQFEFFAAHRLYVESWSEDQNMATFGPCCNANGHGHNFMLEVGYHIYDSNADTCVSGNGTLCATVEKYIKDYLHMTSLNTYVDNELYSLPTCEFVLFKINRELDNLLKNTTIRLKSLRLVETRNNAVYLNLTS